MPQPFIGLTTSRNPDAEGHPRIGLAEAYIQAVAQAGGTPILVPLGLPEPALKQIAGTVDGMLFTGGGDIEPSRYGAPNDDPRAGRIDPDRDRVELTLFQHLLQRGIPFLGICRGLQVINVALGGSLYVDISQDMPSQLQHQNGDSHPRDYLAHPVQVSRNSLLGKILDSEAIWVNSMHHQGIKQLGERLTVVAQAPDGLIEAFEMIDYPFGLAVQWHPECLQILPHMRRIFQAFVEAAVCRTS